MNCEALVRYDSLTTEQAEIILQLDALMSRLAYLTRFYIIGRITELLDEEAIIQEFLKLPAQAKELTQNITGEAVDFTPVTETYIMGLRNLIDGMVSADPALADEGIRQLYAASDQNAALLGQMSQYWDEEAWREIFYRFNRDVVEEVIAVLRGDYNQALNIFERMLLKVRERADYYAEAFIHQLPESGEKISIAYFNMIRDFRQLRTEWALLTRFYMASRITGIGDDTYIIQRFNKLIGRMREKFELILGAEISEEMANMLSVYTVELEGLIDAILSGDESAILYESRLLYQASSEFATYLASINPYWDEGRWNELFQEINLAIIEEAHLLQRGEEIAAIQRFDEIMKASLNIADYFAEGLYLFTISSGEA
jgi:hypothetical protein